LPSDGQCAFQNLEAILPAYAVSQVLGDIDLPLPLNLFCIGAGQAGDEWEQLLPLLIAGFIVQEHRQAADRAREAVGHGLDRSDRLIEEANRDNGCLVDAGSAVLAGEGV
jgi:hypothetical protein